MMWSWTEKMTWTDIGVVITFIGLVVNYAVQYSNNKSNQINLEKARFTNNVVSERIKWLELIRHDLSRYIGITNFYVLRGNGDLYKEERKELDILLIMIKLRLNPVEDNELIITLEKFDAAGREGNNPYLKEYADKIFDLSSKMLKKEWEKVKKESIDGIEIKA